MRRLGATLALLLASASPAAAHPHVWVDYLATIVMDRGRITAIHEQWSFDADFTVLALQDLPPAAERTRLSASDIATLEKSEFSNLRNYAYFNHIFVGPNDAGVGGVSDFTAGMDGPKLVYSFVLHPKAPVDVPAAPVEIGIWDDSFYVDVEPADTPGAVSVSGDAGCRAAIVTDKAHAIYGGLVTPETIKVSCGAR